MKAIGITVFIVMLGGLLLWSAPQRQRPQGRLDPAQMDVNNDGKISKEEWKGPADLFTRIDADKDGYITREEMRQNRPQRGDRRRGRPNFSEMDTNNDGKVSKDEWKGPADLFDRIDANQDGSIVQDEMPTRPQRGNSQPK